MTNNDHGAEDPALTYFVSSIIMNVVIDPLDTVNNILNHVINTALHSIQTHNITTQRGQRMSNHMIKLLMVKKET